MQLVRGRVDDLPGADRLTARLVETHCQGDEPLLSTVMQVALDATPLRVGGLDDPRA